MNPETHKSVMGCVTFLEGAPVMFKSSTQNVICLLVTEAKLAAGVTEVQGMLYVMRVLESMDLKVKKPMVLEMDNKVAFDLANNWSIRGRTQHVDVKQCFLQELKEEGLLVIHHISGAENIADLFTKNLAGNDFKRHVKKICQSTNDLSKLKVGAEEGVRAQMCNSI